MKCSYCGFEVSEFDALFEYGKSYHQDCYIHMTNKELDKYRKKYHNDKLTVGDRMDIIDLDRLIKNIKNNKTEFVGFIPIGEHLAETPKETETSFLITKDSQEIKIERDVSTSSVRFLRTRPVVNKIETITKKPNNRISAEEILKIEGHMK